MGSATSSRSQSESCSSKVNDSEKEDTFKSEALTSENNSMDDFKRKTLQMMQQISVLDMKQQGLLKKLTTKRGLTVDDPVVQMTKEIFLMRHYLTRMPVNEKVALNQPDCRVYMEGISVKLERAKENYAARQKLEVVKEQFNDKLWNSHEVQHRLNMLRSQVQVDENGRLPYISVMQFLFKQEKEQRSPFVINSLVPFCMTQPFFKDRGIKDQALGDLLNLMTFQEFKQD